MITKFKDDYEFLSNFYITKNGYCVEAYYQASKFIEHPEVLTKIMSMKPGKGKRFANLPEHKSLIRKDWKKVNLLVMENLIREKFSNEPERSMLKNTGDEELIEGNYWHDNFYGSCDCENCKFIPKLNHLGKILMKIREEIK